MFTTRIVLLLLGSVFLTQWQEAKSSEVNSTTTTTTSQTTPTTRPTQSTLFDDDEDDEVDEALENMDFAEFKERYRRLIQYRTYYVASNYLNSQVLGGAHQQQPHNYERETALPTNPLIRKPQRLVPVGRPIDPSRRKPNGRPSSNVPTTTSHKHEDKFVPSIQYDPKEIGGDTDYFTPVKYAPKLNYDTMEYSATGSSGHYERPQQRPPIYQEIVASAPMNLRQETGFYNRERPPARPANNLYLRKYIPTKQKPSGSNLHQDYVLEYGTRTSNPKPTFSSSDYSYPADDFESVRYVNIEPPLPPPPPPPPQSHSQSHPKPTRILAQSLPRKPSSVYFDRNPAVNFNDIMKSLQLTNRLPEMLNKDNIDSSIKTLVEILSILNNAKHEDYPKLPENHATNVPTIYGDNYNNYKQYTRPKVVTESRFQATPRPAIQQEENIRFDMENYEPNVNYVANKPKQHHVVEYYTPLIQDIDEIEEERLKSTERPQNVEDNTEHTYEITEDLADDILEQDKYALPATTEVPVSKFQLPDGVSTHTQLVPPTTLKYGATRGKPNVDYPAYAAIPKTEFNCKEQRYKGFFGDPSTGCQVWHYCDLNGGKSSFLCPNGTIFSQVALTCDWWFNVQCESTTQLYVLNERLYKYILPIMPKFPEDFSGPEVDRYLELKFKEMEAKLKEKKLKKQQQKDKVKEKLQALETEE